MEGETRFAVQKAEPQKIAVEKIYEHPEKRRQFVIEVPFPAEIHAPPQKFIGFIRGVFIVLSGPQAQILSAVVNEIVFQSCALAFR